jgi:cyclophilin family peptidyl-prolyl cis-trans isomerase
MLTYKRPNTIKQIIDGGTFQDEKNGLKRKFHQGAIGMANAGKNSNASQFFIVLTNKQTEIEKLNGHYVCFATITKGIDDLLKALDDVESVGEKPSVEIRIEDCSCII